MGTVKIARAGGHLMVKGTTVVDVEAAVAELIRRGGKLIDSIKPLGNNWIATVQDQDAAETKAWSTVTSIGLQSVIEGANYEIVVERIAELTTYGAALVAGPENVEGKWVAVVDTRASAGQRG
jgi:hypothetical protein